jgi:hypothetical protein
MEIKGIGAFTAPVAPSGKSQPPSRVAEPGAGTEASVKSLASAGAPEGRPHVRAKDLLSEDEQRYLESLFPGATDGGSAGETYAGVMRQGAVPPGTLVDRKG